jgi:hypothetical protein
MRPDPCFVDLRVPIGVGLQPGRQERVARAEASSTRALSIKKSTWALFSAVRRAVVRYSSPDPRAWESTSTEFAREAPTPQGSPGLLADGADPGVGDVHCLLPDGQAAMLATEGHPAWRQITADVEDLSARLHPRRPPP